MRMIRPVVCRCYANACSCTKPNRILRIQGTFHSIIPVDKNCTVGRLDFSMKNVGYMSLHIYSVCLIMSFIETLSYLQI